MSRSQPEAGPAWWEWVLLLAAYGLVLLTIVVYPTFFNPGLPIALGGWLAAVAGAVLAARGSGSGHRGLPLALAFLGWSLLSALWPVDRYLAARSATTLVGATALVVILQCTLRSASAWHVAARLLVGLCTVISLIGLPEVAVPALAEGRLPVPRSTFANPDTYAVVPLLGVLLGLGQLVAVRGLSRVVLLLELPFLLICLVGTGCRAAVLGLAVGLAVYLGMLLRSRVRGGRAALLSFAALVVGALLFGWGYAVPGMHKWSALTSPEALEHEKLRLDVIPYGLRASVRHPVLGSGPGTFGLAYQAVRPPGMDRYFLDLAHNDFIEVLVEVGWVGLALWLGLILAAALKLLDSILHGRRPVEAAAVLAAIVGAMVFSSFQFLLSQRPALYILYLVLGLALSFPTSRRLRPEPRWARLAGAGILLAGGIWAGIFGVCSLAAEGLMQQAERDEASLLWESAGVRLDQALALQPDRLSLRRDRARLFGKMAALGEGDDSRKAQEQQLQAALRSSPLDVPTMQTLAQLYTDMADYGRSEQMLLQARQAAPYNGAIGVQLASLWLRQGRLEDAAGLLGDRALSEPNSSLEQLEALLLNLELNRAGSSLPLARRWLSEPSRAGRAREVLLKVVSELADNASPEAAGALVQVLVLHDRADWDSRLEAARVMGRLRGPAAELAELAALLREIPESEVSSHDLALQRWAEAASRVPSPTLVDDLSQLVKRFPERSWLRVRLSSVYEGHGQLDKAGTVIREGLSDSPQDPVLLARLAEVYEKAGSLDLALVYYQDALRQAPEDAYLLGKVNGIRGRR